MQPVSVENPLSTAYRLACLSVIAECLQATGDRAYHSIIEMGIEWTAGLVARELKTGGQRGSVKAIADQLVLHTPQRVELVGGWCAVMAPDVGAVYLMKRH